MSERMPFDEWWAVLQGLAVLEGLDLVGDRDDYWEYYADGDSPERTIEIELSYKDEDDEDGVDDYLNQVNGTRLQ